MRMIAIMKMLPCTSRINGGTKTAMSEVLGPPEVRMQRTVARGSVCPEEWNWVINDMWELDMSHRAPIFNYPDFPLNEGQSVDINDQLSFIIPKLED